MITFSRQCICSVVSLHSGMSRAVHPQGRFRRWMSTIDTCLSGLLIPCFTFCSKRIESVRMMAYMWDLTVTSVIILMRLLNYLQYRWMNLSLWSKYTYPSVIILIWPDFLDSTGKWAFYLKTGIPRESHDSQNRYQMIITRSENLPLLAKSGEESASSAFGCCKPLSHWSPSVMKYRRWCPLLQRAA